MPTLSMKNEIVKVFTRLVKTKDADKITVQEVAAECGISRQAFYYHFQDILAISEWVLQEKLKELIDNAKSETSPREKFYLFVKAVADNAMVIRKMHGTERGEALERSLSDMMRIYLEQIFENYKGKNDFTMSFYAFCVPDYLVMRVCAGNINAEEMTNQLYKLLEKQLDA